MDKNDQTPPAKQETELQRSLTTDIVTGLATGVGIGAGSAAIGKAADLLNRPPQEEQPKTEVILLPGVEKPE
jgi:hypothetical protein